MLPLVFNAMTQLLFECTGWHKDAAALCFMTLNEVQGKNESSSELLVLKVIYSPWQEERRWTSSYAADRGCTQPSHVHQHWLFKSRWIWHLPKSIMCLFGAPNFLLDTFVDTELTGEKKRFSFVQTNSHVRSWELRKKWVSNTNILYQLQWLTGISYLQYKMYS